MKFIGGIFKLPHRNLCNKIIEKWEQPIAGYDTGIKIYNCIVNEKVPLILPNKNFSTWYTCGPTVYASSHIGHASCYLKLDIIQRILREYFHINLITGMNITDIDDKIINKSILTNSDWKTIAKQYEHEFWSDLTNLNIVKPNFILRVTENINEIIKFIGKLMNLKMAYCTSDGSVYFDVESFKRYGKLVTINFENIESNTETLLNESDQMNKRSIVDFALWKSTKSTAEPSWSVPWSNYTGRPGWHIECSTLATIVFGNHVDFHAGGLDLKFPHHENEEAQSCAYHQHNQWINYWLHTGQLHSEKTSDQKMSKSLKNTISITDLLKEYTSNEFRMACILSNYRNQMNYDKKSMIKSRSILKRIEAFQSDSKFYINGDKRSNFNDIHLNLHKKLNEIHEQIDGSIRDDFNTSKSIEHLLDLITFTNKIINPSVNMIMNEDDDDDRVQVATDLTSIQAVRSFIDKIIGCFGFNIIDENKNGLPQQQQQHIGMNITEILDNIINIRSNLRDEALMKKDKNLFEICDNIRDSLKQNNIEIKDHGKKSSWKYIK